MVDDNKKKITTRLVERPRDEKWWHDEDCYMIPNFKPPVILGTILAVIHNSYIYCLDYRFDFAKVLEINVNDTIALASTPVWCGDKRIAVSALFNDGRYQALTVEMQADKTKLTAKTLMSGKVYNANYIFEDRHPISPIFSNGQLVFIDPYGHYYFDGNGVSGQLNVDELMRINAPLCLDSLGQIILKINNDNYSWLEWRDASTMEFLFKSEQYNNRWGFTIGEAGCAPKVTSNGNVLCGFGERLICFNARGKTIWQFAYPQLDALDSTGIKIYKGDSSQEQELVYETNSEVTISSNIIEYDSHIYFVLYEGTRYMSYVVKMERDSGNVIWTSRIDDYSGPFFIPYISDSKLYLQNRYTFWLITENGKHQEEYELDLDCTSCSEAVRVSENKFAVNSDLGIHTFELQL